MQFKPLKESQEPLVKSWLSSKHVAEHWYGKGLTNTLKTISQFLKGEKTIFSLWIVYDGNVPFGFLITSTIDFRQDNLFSKYLNAQSNAITLDLLIGNTDYLGKGLGSKMILEFLKQKHPHVTDVFVDPEIKNQKAIHVYEKASFEKLGTFIPEWDPTIKCILMQKKIHPN